MGSPSLLQIIIQCAFNTHIRTPIVDSPSSRLKLVECVPPGARQAQVCAALWQHGAEVRLVAPVLRHPPRAETGWLDGVLTWFDAACFAARKTHDLHQACSANPEWRLRCVPFDGSDRALNALSGLLRSCLRLRGSR
jgi:hypothetical protein